MQSDIGGQSRTASSERHRISILRKAFDVYDVDGSGAIDYDEFKRLLDDLGWPSHEEFLRRAVRVLDQDMSGEIEFSEFQKWTKFAYASRILYRQEMYGSGPRYAPEDDMNLQSGLDQPRSTRGGLVFESTSLGTVFEKPEENSRESSRSAYQCGASSDEDEAETGGPRLAAQSSQSRNENDEDHEQKSDRANLSGSSSKECSEFTRKCLSSAFLPQPEREGKKYTECSKSNHDKATRKEENFGDGNEVETTERDLSTPVKEMATMVLTPSRRGDRVHRTSPRSKSKPPNVLRELLDRPLVRRTVEEIKELGPRTESKRTVRMRWACGQYGNAVGGDDRQRESNSRSNNGGSSEEEAKYEGAAKTCNQPQPTNADDSGRGTASSMSRRHPGHSAAKVPTSGNYDVWQDVGVDLRRIRSD